MCIRDSTKPDAFRLDDDGADQRAAKLARMLNPSAGFSPQALTTRAAALNTLIQTAETDADAIQGALALKDTVRELGLAHRVELAKHARTLIGKAFGKLRSGERTPDEVEAAMLQMVELLEG